MKKNGIIALLTVALTACAHYQGPGTFKTGSDYPAPPTAAPLPDPLLTPSPGQGPFQLRWPVSFVRITQNFEPAKNPHHKGLDLGGPRGTPILAAHEGLVVYTGRDFHGYGNMVLIEYNHEWATLYAHLQKIKVRQGQRIRAGSLVGNMGRTGHATGVHLHFELMHKKDPVDPLLHLSGTEYVAGQSKR
jgi:murein DD-endopeptidase MepM/ murein hydrolase activator NlpD